MKFAEMMFYAEAEGLLPTRQGRINAVIKDVKEYPGSSIEFTEFERILRNHGLCYAELTDRELRYIRASVG